MENSEANQAFTRSQRTTGLDLNNVQDPTTGVRSKQKSNTESLKNSKFHIVHTGWKKHHTT